MSLPSNLTIPPIKIEPLAVLTWVPRFFYIRSDSSYLDARLYSNSNWTTHGNISVCKVQLIQKSSKIFFLDIFTWFYRARRAL